MLYSDDKCTTPLETGPHVSVTNISLYFKPSEHEFSSGGPAWARTLPPPGEEPEIYATLPWTAEDGNGGSHSATIRVNVTAVNDRPVAGDGANPADVYMGIGAAIFMNNGTDLDGHVDTDRLTNCRIRLVTTPINVGNGQSGGQLFRLTRDANGLLRSTGNALAAGDETILGSDPSDGLGLWYVSRTDFTSTQGLEEVGDDQFTFRLIDADGLTSNIATYSIVILSGLRAKMTSSDRVCSTSNPSDCGCDTCSLIVEEEVLSLVALRGLNQNGGSTAANALPVTPFLLKTLPSHGTLYQYDATRTGNRGDQITAGDNLTDAGLPCDNGPNSDCPCGPTATSEASKWMCKRVLYEGHLNYFNWPAQTYDGTDLNVTTETLEYQVSHQDGTVSAPATVFLRVRNVNDPPVMSGPPNTTFVTEQWMKIFDGITLADSDRGLGYYRVTLKLDQSVGKMTELAHKQSGTEDASWDKWQGENQMSNVVNVLLDYCPDAVCNRGPSSLKGCATSCASGDGSQDWEIEMFVTLATLRKVFTDLEFYCKTPTNNELSIIIEDFDDGEGAMDVVAGRDHLQTEFKLGIFPGEVGENGGYGSSSSGQKTGTSDSTITYVAGVVVLLVFLVVYT